MAGKYYLNESIELTSEDNNLVIQNYNDEQAIVSGALNVPPSWEPYRDNIFMTFLNVSTPPSNQVQVHAWVNRIARTRAAITTVLFDLTCHVSDVRQSVSLMMATTMLATTSLKQRHPPPKPAVTSARSPPSACTSLG